VSVKRQQSARKGICVAQGDHSSLEEQGTGRDSGLEGGKDQSAAVEDLGQGGSPRMGHQERDRV
jgi:hypothetical protein